MPSFYGRTLSHTVPAPCTSPPCQEMAKSTRQPKVRLPPGILLIPVKSQQSLTLLTGVLSLHRCCTVSAVILTTSKLEAILKIYRCSLKTVQRGRGAGGGALPCTSSPDKHNRRQMKWCARWGERWGGGGWNCSQQITTACIPLSPCLSVRCVSGGVR